MFVGGEFYSDNRWFSESPTISTQGMCFLNGGKACLMVICDYLINQHIEKILLPSYLCPSIVTTLERGGLVCDYYMVNEDFSIDLDDLAKKCAGYKALYFINYFGFLHAPDTVDFFKNLQKNGVIVVEDNAQAGFVDHPTGTFVFNSMRKLIPNDGGYLVTPLDMTPYLKQYLGRPNRRLAIIRDYRERLYDYLFKAKGSHAELEEMFNLAEHFYDTDLVVHGDPQERFQIERLDWERIKQIRRDNYQYMLGLISSIPEICPIFPALQENNMPMGLPIYFPDVSRDLVCEELGNAEIGLTIHWEEIPLNPRTNGNAFAVEMANRILTLTIDQRTSRKQMDHLALHLIKAIAVVKGIGTRN